MTHDTDHPFDAEASTLDALSPERRRAVLSAYLDDELSPSAARDVTAWLDRNPVALKEIEHLRRTWDLLDLYEDEAVPPDFAEDVLDAVGARPRRLSGRLRLGLVAAAAALLVALGIGILGTRPPEPPVQQAEVGVLDEVPADLLADVDLLLSLTDEEFHGVLLDEPDAP